MPDNVQSTTTNLETLIRLQSEILSKIEEVQSNIDEGRDVEGNTLLIALVGQLSLKTEKVSQQLSQMLQLYSMVLNSESSRQAARNLRPS